MDFCKFFQDIEKDPRAPIDITVGEFYAASDHAKECAGCHSICERVAAMDDGHEPGLTIGLN